MAKGKAGRPRKIGPKERETIEAVLSSGGSLEDAAALVGMNASTIRRSRKADPEFARGLRYATAQGKLVLLKRVTGSEDWKASAWMLERRWGKQFGKQQPVKVEHTGANGGPIETKTSHCIDYEAIERELADVARDTAVARRIAENN